MYIYGSLQAHTLVGRYVLFGVFMTHWAECIYVTYVSVSAYIYIPANMFII